MKMEDHEYMIRIMRNAPSNLQEYFDKYGAHNI